jgi:SAM-dependent methyltransferase
MAIATGILVRSNGEFRSRVEERDSGNPASLRLISADPLLLFRGQDEPVRGGGKKKGSTMAETGAEIRAMVRERFARIATAPEDEKKFPVGPLSAKTLGYDPEEIDRLPLSVTKSFAGVGNPLSLGEIHPGQTLVDLGSGAGLDSILAARRVGGTGKVVGVDLVEAMVEKARRNVEALGIENVEFLHGAIEDLPLEDAVADIAISNGVFNLCPEKPKALAETYRVLRPGGWLLMADILLEDHVTPEEVTQLGTWSD